MEKILSFNTEKNDKNAVQDIKYTVENLGNFTRTIYMRINDGGYRNDGTPVLYSVTDGNPKALFIMFDAQTGKILLERELSKSSGAWEVFVHSSKDVYIVGHGKPFLYKFDHKTEEIAEIGDLPNRCSMGQVVCEGKNGMIYSGSTDTVYFWAYDPNEGEFAEMPVLVPNATKYPALAYDKKENKLYISVISRDSKNYLFRVDPDTKEKEDITPEEYRNNAKYQFYDMRIYGDILFIRYPATQETLFYNIRKDKLVSFDEEGKTGGDIPMKTYLRQPAADPEDDKRFYSVLDNKLALFDTETMTYKITDIPANAQMIRMVMLKLDQEKYPGYSACSLFSHMGEMQFINIMKKENVRMNTKVAGGCNEGNCLTVTDSNKLIIGGNYGGSTGVYDIKTGARITYKGIAQQECVRAYGNKVFFGSYPCAQLQCVDTDKDWSPRHVLSMWKSAEISDYHNQDRPYNMLPVYEKGIMAVTSNPAQSFTRGAIAFINASDNSVTYHDKFPLEGMSAASLAYANSTLFMGTTTSAGYGTEPVNDQAVLVEMNMDTKEYKKYDLPFEARAVTALCTSNDGKVWGMGWNNIFCFDPVTEKFLYSRKLDILCNNKCNREFKISADEDGNRLYISSLSTKAFYRFDISSEALYTVAENIGWYHVRDKEGSFYFINGINVNKLTFEN